MDRNYEKIIILKIQWETYLPMEHINKAQIINYNAIGIEDSNQADHQSVKEMIEIKDQFQSFENMTKEEFQILIKKNLYGNLTRDEFDKEILKYKTVQEGLKHIPGRLPEKEFQKELYQLIEDVTNKLNELKYIAESKRIYKKDYKKIKESLLMTILRLFGAVNDLTKFELTVHILEEMEIVPVNSKESLFQLTSHARWI
jgi:hypothetical protein